MTSLITDDIFTVIASAVHRVVKNHLLACLAYVPIGLYVLLLFFFIFNGHFGDQISYCTKPLVTEISGLVEM